MELRLVIELTTAEEVDEHWRSHLSVGGAFARGAAAEQQQACTLVLIARGGAPLELPARAVYTSPEGVGLQLDGFDGELRKRLQAWVDASAADDLDGQTIRVQPETGAADDLDGETIRVQPETGAADDLDGETIRVQPETGAADDLDDQTIRVQPGTWAAGDLDGETVRVQPGIPTVRFSASATAPSPARRRAPVPAPAPAPMPAPVPIPVPVPVLSADPDPDPAPEDEEDTATTDAATADAEDADADRDPVARNVFERLRNLSVVEQLKCAREGEINERMALERLYGKLVWEALLRNPRVTPHEVARIARMGALPRPLLEMIVSNTAWLRVPEVRRAVLTNTRLGVEAIPRVLRLLPKHELRVVPNQTAYPAAVREAARRLLKEA